MKTILKFAVIMIFAVFLTACDKEDQDTASDLEAKSGTQYASRNNINGNGGGIIGPEYAQAQQQVMETFGEIAQSIIDGDMDKLISFHAYGPKFTEFKDGSIRNDGAANEAYERNLFGVLVQNVVKFEANAPKIAVYGGNVANLTFHSDFELDFGDGIPFPVKNQITLLFVRTNDGWKMVHEHHSPLTESAMNSY
jgi:ketosteroid isomerase-like protein